METLPPSSSMMGSPMINVFIVCSSLLSSTASKKFAYYLPFKTFSLSLIKIYLGVMENGDFFKGSGLRACQFVSTILFVPGYAPAKDMLKISELELADP